MASEAELIEWVNSLLGSDGEISNLTSDWCDGYMMGLLCQKIGIYDDDVVFVRRETEDNWDIISMTEEHLADELGIHLNSKMFESLKCGKGSTDLFESFHAYAKKHLPEELSQVPSKPKLGVLPGEVKRASTLVRHEETYGHALDEGSAEMISNPLLSSSQNVAGGSHAARPPSGRLRSSSSGSGATELAKLAYAERKKNMIKSVSIHDDNDGGSVGDDHVTTISAAKRKMDQNVDEMKIQTMYKMVEECNVQVQGMQVNKKVLYLTNKQACLFDEAAMQRCIQALDIGDPKFVIRLLPSASNFSIDIFSHDERFKTQAEYEVYQFYNNSEICDGDMRITNSQILLFMRTCVLPLAKQTKALILLSGADDCYLGAALASLALQEQARLGKDCPFHVLACAYEFEIHYRAINNPESLASQMLKSSAAWSIRMPYVERMISNDNKRKGYAEDDPTALQHCDLSPAASHYIIFESYDPETGNENRAPKKAFEATLLQSITRKLPSIAVQAMMIASEVQHVVELAQRGIPVLMLDVVERAISMQRKLGDADPTTTLAVESEAFPNVSKDLADKVLQDRGASFESRKELLNLAIALQEAKRKAQAAHGIVDIYEASTLSFFHSALQLGSKSSETNASQNVALFQRIQELEEMSLANKDTSKNIVPAELASAAINFLQTRDKELEIECKISKVVKWLEKHKDLSDREEYVENLYPNAIIYRDVLVETLDRVRAVKGGEVKEMRPNEWLSYFDVFTTANIFSGSIHDIDELKRIMGSVAKIDRLPQENSLQALRTLQDCWDHVEIYHSIADSYKKITKLSYHLLLSMGLLVTAFSVADVQFSRVAIIILSFLSTIIVSFITYMNPSVRWQQLRVAALSVESNIWLFRTRSGPYRTDGNEFDDLAEKTLAEFLIDLKMSVLEGADLKNTAFYSKKKSKNEHLQHDPRVVAGFGTLDSYALSIDAAAGDSEDDKYKKSKAPAQSTEHAQQRRSSVTAAAINECKLEDVVYSIRKGESTSENSDKDSHYQPVQPDFYIRHRVHKSMMFYKGRIPTNNRVRNIAQFLTVISSIMAGGTAYFDASRYAAILSIISSGISAFMEFNGTSSKITRYSAVVNSLQELILWWQTLPQIDKSAVQNIDKLVVTCEDLLQKEMSSWQGASQSMRISKKNGNSGESKESNLTN